MSCFHTRSSLRANSRMGKINRQSMGVTTAATAAVESLESRTLLSSVVVNSTSDTDTDTSPGVVTLRDAITMADSSTDPAVITFDPTVFAKPQTITLNGAVLELSNTAFATTITGPAAGVTISGNNLTEGFQIDSGVTAVLSDLAIVDCTADVGGAISNSGNLVLTDSTLSDNDATSNDDGAGLADFGTSTLINDTLANNTGDGIDERGGASTLINCTVSGNSSYASFSAGGIYIDGGTVTLGNTIVAGNTSATGGPDVFGTFNSLGNNLIGAIDGSAGWISSDLTGTVAAPLSADLGPLANNGGPTQTFLPLAGSPAIGAGSTALISSGVTTDQRGLPRTHNGTVDIGSVEEESGNTVTPPESIGGLDLTFGTDGLAGHDIGFASTTGVAQDGAQSVLIGPIGASPTESFGVTRYNSDGSVDTTFAGGGVATTSFGGTDDVPQAVAVLAGGQILVAGTASTFTSDGIDTGSEFAVAEYNADGSLDTGFGGGTGEALVSFSSASGTLSNDVLKATAVSPAGVIYLGGSSDAAGNGSADFALAALNADGTIDTGFGASGLVLQDFAGGDDVINGLALQSNGDIVAAGSATIGGVAQIALARFLPGGAIDTRFGTKGTVTTNVRGVYDSASSVVLQSNGQIVIGGLSATGSGASLSSDFVVARYSATGRIDRTFGGGPVITSFGQPSAVTQVLVLANGEIVASGKTTATLTSFAANSLDVAVARYTTRGVLDPTFNGTGKAIIDFEVGVISASASHVSPLTLMSIVPLDASSLGAEFDQFTSSQQGVVAVTPGGEILDAGIDGSDTVEAQIITAGVDLSTALLSALPSVVPGGLKGTASISITEAGTTQAQGTVTVQLQIATDAQGDGAVTLTSATEKINLRQGKDHTYRFSFVYPVGVAAANYYLLATVVDQGSLKDLNLANNTAASTATVNISPPLIMITGSELSATSAFDSGKSAGATINLTNNGNVLAHGKMTVEFFLSTDLTPADGMQIAAPAVVISLAPGKSHLLHLRFLLPSLSANTYNLLALVDPANSLGSTDSSDSLVVDATAVTVS